jgi:hypothetical protein
MHPLTIINQPQTNLKAKHLRILFFPFLLTYPRQ